MKRIFLISLAVVSLTGCDVLSNNPSNPTTPSNPGQYSYTAIGASDAIGFGSTNVCFPFTACPNGTGYVQDLSRKYQADHPSVTLDLLNMGIPGAVLGPTCGAVRTRVVGAVVDGVVVDGDGNFYVSDGGNNRVQKFSAGGGLLARWGTDGSGPDRFHHVCDGHAAPRRARSGARYVVRLHGA